ncbi:hypothetical protein U1769_25170, partial [Sphingomonas sp. ZT3P38]|uniref:hypothetical protein n=1 Tax=Parasphingomonas zepuensis TaxID=3096161 RepID=UPI002FCAF51B
TAFAIGLALSESNLPQKIKHVWRREEDGRRRCAIGLLSLAQERSTSANNNGVNPAAIFRTPPTLLLCADA